MITTSNTHIQIAQYSKNLRLPIFGRDFEQLAIESTETGASYEEFLLQLMEREYERRLENRKKSQIRQAGFPSKMYLNELNLEQLPIDAKDKLPILERPIL